MVRCFYGSSRPNHDGDFPPSSDDSAARWGGSMDGHPPNLHRQHFADAEHRWNGPNPPEIGHEANNSSQRHDAPLQTNEVEAAPHIIPPSPPRRATRFTPKTP